MKNTLAENLLRFGVKNLKDADKQKLSETVLTEAFQKNYWIDSITKDPNSAMYTINVTGNFAAKLGLEVQRNALMGPWNQDLLSVQLKPGQVVNTIQDLDKYLSTPQSGFGAIQFMNLQTGKGAFQNEKAAAKLKTIKSYYKGVNPQTNKPFEYGVNVNPNTLYQMLLESMMGALGKA
jgi:hypothetical protein